LQSSDSDAVARVRDDLSAIARSDIADVMEYRSGELVLRKLSDIPESVRRAIRRVKVVPMKNGTRYEIEFYDKISALRLLARHYGLLEPGSGSSRPSVIGINLYGPEGPREVRELTVVDPEEE